MKTHIKTTWNWFRLLALGSILVCAQAQRANAAVDPVIQWSASQTITYGDTLVSGSAPLNAKAVDPVTSADLGGSSYYTIGDVVIGQTGQDPLASNAGGYTVTFHWLTPNADAYNSKTATSTLIVNRRALTLTMRSYERVYGADNPSFLYDWSPEAPRTGDNISVIPSFSVKNSSPVGLYSISASFNDPKNLATNYSITVNSGTLTVKKVDLNLAAAVPLNVVYGQSNVFYTRDNAAISATFPAGVTYKDDLTNLVVWLRLFNGTAFDAAPVNNHIPDAGTYYYKIVAAEMTNSGVPFANLGNFNVISNISTLTVSKAPLTLTANDQQQQYGYFASYSGTVTKLISGDTNYTEVVGPWAGAASAPAPTKINVPAFNDADAFEVTWNSTYSDTSIQTNKPGQYAITGQIKEKTSAAGRLAKNYQDVKIIPAKLTVQKRVPQIGWTIAAADQVQPYGKGVYTNGNVMKAAILNPVDKAVYPNPNETSPTLSYPTFTEPLDAGPQLLTVNAIENDFWAAGSASTTITVQPGTPNVKWTGENTTTDDPKKGYIGTVSYGTLISATQLAAIAEGVTGGTAPGNISYFNVVGGNNISLLPGTLFTPLESATLPAWTYPATPSAYTLLALVAPNKNYFSASRTVKLQVTNGVFTVGSADPKTIPANTTVASAFTFKGIAKVGDLTITNGRYFANSGATIPATISAVLVNTNTLGAGQTTIPVNLTPVEPDSKGEFTLTGSIDPATFWKGVGLTNGAKFELQVTYPDAYVSKDPSKPADSAQMVLAVMGATKKYAVQVDLLQPELTIDNLTLGYGSNDVISMPIKVKFAAGYSPILNGTNVDVFFKQSIRTATGVEHPVYPGKVVLTADPGAETFSGTFELPINGPAAGGDFRTNYNVWNGPYEVKFTLQGNSIAYKGVTNLTRTVTFTKRVLNAFAFHKSALPDLSANVETITYGDVDGYKALAPKGETGAGELVGADSVVVNAALPDVFTPTGTYSVQVGQLAWGDGVAQDNYSVTRHAGNLTVMRRNVRVYVEDNVAITNVPTPTLTWKLENTVADGVTAANLAFTGSGKIELATDRVLTSKSGDTFVITNKFGTNISGVWYILTNYSEATGPTDVTTPVSMYISGDKGTNYYVTTSRAKGNLVVVGTVPVADWKPADMTYGDIFASANILNGTGSVKTNGVADTNPDHYAYYVFQNEDPTKNEAADDIAAGKYKGYILHTNTPTSWQVPMATDSLAVMMVYKTGDPNIAALDGKFSTLPPVKKTIKVKKAGLFVTTKMKTDSVTKANDLLTSLDNWNIVIDVNQPLNNDALYPEQGSKLRPIFARQPVVSKDFVSCDILTNATSILTPVGNYGISPIVSDKGFNAPSNYNVVYISSVYKVTGATVTGGPSRWENTENVSNVVFTYGWAYAKSYLVKLMVNHPEPLIPAPAASGVISYKAPTATDPVQWTQFKFLIGDSTTEVAEGTVLPAQLSKLTVIYQPNPTYEAKTLVNKIKIAKYPIHVFLAWDNARLKQQTNRAYADKVEYFPVLWANGTNFNTNLDLKLDRYIANIANDFTNFVTFGADYENSLVYGSDTINEMEAKWKYTSGSTEVILTNGAGIATNLWFATPSEKLSDLGMKLYDKSTVDSPLGLYDVDVKITSSSAGNYDIIVLNEATVSGKLMPDVPSIQVTNALLKFVTDDKSRYYGETNPVFTGTVFAQKTDGSLVANKDGITMKWVCYATTNSPVTLGGTYFTIYGEKDLDPNFMQPNYLNDMSKANGKLTINPAPLTATPSNTPAADPYKLRPGQVFDVAKLPTTYSTAQLKNGDTLAAVVSKNPVWASTYNAATAKVGDKYTVSVGTAGTVNTNYALAYATREIQVMENTPPTGVADAVAAVQGDTSKILVSKLVANDYSPFNDKLTFIMSDFPKSSARGIGIDKDITDLWLYYNTGKATLSTTGYDTFTYRIKDSVGGIGSGTVYVKVVTPNPDYRPNNFKGATLNQDTGELTLEFIGLDSRRYRVQGSATLTSPTWKDLQLYDRSTWPDLSAAGLVTTNIFNCVNGVIKVTDPAGISAGGQFYRAIVN